jgi:3-dehydroquinate dehydratase
MTQVVTGIISGLGVHGYELVVQHPLQRHAVWARA